MIIDVFFIAGQRRVYIASRSLEGLQRCLIRSEMNDRSRLAVRFLAVPCKIQFSLVFTGVIDTCVKSEDSVSQLS